MAFFTPLLTPDCQAFPALAHKTYLNFGGQGPLPQPAYQAIKAYYRQLDANGPFSIAANGEVQRINQTLRHRLGTLLNVDPMTLALTDNVTTGCNIALWGLDWRSGDDILLTDCEHPGIIAIVQAIAARFGVTYRFCPLLNAQESPETVIAAHLTPRTRLVVLSHLLWNTGQVLPLPAIVQACRAYPTPEPIQILVDGAQSVGSLPLDLNTLGVDYYAFTGHKWLCGPAGVGGLYIRGDRLETLQPTYVGWRSITYGPKGEPTGWTQGAQRFEVATSAYGHYVALDAAIAFHQSQGLESQRYGQICALSGYLWEQLNLIPGVHCLIPHPPAAGLVSFTIDPPASPKAIVQQLEDQGIYVRTIADPSCIRACCHYFTSPQDIDHLVQTLKTVIPN